MHSLERGRPGRRRRRVLDRRPPSDQSLGATDEEIVKPLPGDELENIVGDRPISTRAITIDAPPEAVWPWLVQMGSGRAGFYTHECVERLLLITYLGGTIRTRRYSPGVATSVLLYLPLTVGAVAYLVANGVVDPISVPVSAVTGIGIYRLIISRSRRHARAAQLVA